MATKEGWISLYRKVLSNPVIMKDADHFAVWCYLLLSATHKRQKAVFGNEKITLEEGQLIIGRKKIASDLKISESKVERILNYFNSEQRFEQQSEQQNEQHFERQIEQQKNSKGRLITMKNWGVYQKVNNTFEGQVNNEVNSTLNNVSDTNNNIYNNTNNNISNNINNTNKEIDNKNNRIISEGDKSKSVRERVAAASSPTLEIILSYALPFGIGKEYCKKFFNYYEGIGWVNGNGIAIKNWKNVLQNWFTRDNITIVNKPAKEKIEIPDYNWLEEEEETMSEAEQESMKERLRKYK